MTSAPLRWAKALWHKYGVWCAYERIENGVRLNDGFKDDTIIYRTFYLGITHHIALWFIKKTRSGSVIGDCSLRIWTQEYTEQYHGMFERIRKRFREYEEEKRRMRNV